MTFEAHQINSDNFFIFNKRIKISDSLINKRQDYSLADIHENIFPTI